MPVKVQEVIEQGNVTQGRRTRTRAEELLADFGAELGFGAADMPKEARESSLTYIVDVILPISWYATKIKDAQNVRLAYIIGTGALILVIPTMLALLAVITADPASSMVVA